MRVVIASDQAMQREQLRQAVLSLGLECDAGDLVSFAQLAQRLSQGDAMLALVAAGLDHAAVLTAVHSSAQSSTPLFAVWDGYDGAVIPALLRAGVRGYLRQSELHDDLLSAVKELRNSEAIEVKGGCVIAFTSGLPGVGVTTVATHLAFALAAQHPGQVALAQLGQGMPDLALNLDLKPKHQLAEIAAGWCRLDTALLNRCLVDYPSGPSILTDQPGQTRSVEWQPAALRQVLVLLRSRFAFVVVDLGHGLDPAQREALQFADEVGVIMRLDVPAVRMGRQFLAYLHDAGVPQEKLVGIVNRFGQKDQVPWKQAREALGMEVSDWVPDDPGRVNFALNAGKSLVETARSAPITRSFAKLASRWPDGASAQRSLSAVGLSS